MRAYFHILNEFLQADNYNNATCELHEVSKSTESLQSQYTKIQSQVTRSREL